MTNMSENQEAAEWRKDMGRLSRVLLSHTAECGLNFVEILQDLSAAVHTYDYKPSMKEAETLAASRVGHFVADAVSVLAAGSICYRVAGIPKNLKSNRPVRTLLGLGGAFVMHQYNKDELDTGNLKALLALPTPMGGELELLLQENMDIPPSAKEYFMQFRQAAYSNADVKASHVHIRPEGSLFPTIAHTSISDASTAQQARWEENPLSRRDTNSAMHGAAERSRQVDDEENMSNSSRQDQSGASNGDSLQELGVFSMASDLEVGWGDAEGDQSGEGQNDYGRIWKSRKERRDARRQKRQENIGHGASKDWGNDSLDGYFDSRWDGPTRAG